MEFTSRWRKPTETAAEFQKRFEHSRQLFAKPLDHLYQNIYLNEFRNAQAILSLGIGTGYVEGKMGIPEEGLTAIDISANFLRLAQTRFPKANLILGSIESGLQQVDQQDVTLASESLDCLDPNALAKVLAKIRKKSNKLVLIQTFAPDPEFYSFRFPHASGSYGGPGMEGLNPTLSAAVAKRLTAMGISESPLGDPLLLLDQLEAAFARKFGAGGLPVSLRELLEINDLDGRSVKQILPKIPDVPFQRRPLISQAIIYLDLISQTLEKYRAINYPAGPERNSWQMARYNRSHTAKRVFDAIEGNLSMEAYLAVMQTNLAQAGFSRIEVSTDSANSDLNPDKKILMLDFARSLSSLRDESISVTELNYMEAMDRTKNGIFFPGSPATLIMPADHHFMDAAVTTITAKS